MAEFEEKLGAILNNPQAMGQIMALAQSLSGQTANGDGSPPPQPQPSPVEGEIQEAVFEPVSALNDEELPSDHALPHPDIDPRLLELGLRAVSAYQNQNDEKSALLRALRPFVSEERAKKVDKAVQITRMTRAIRAVLDGIKGGREGV